MSRSTAALGDVFDERWAIHECLSYLPDQRGNIGGRCLGLGRDAFGGDEAGCRGPVLEPPRRRRGVKVIIVRLYSKFNFTDCAPLLPSWLAWLSYALALGAIRSRRARRTTEQNASVMFFT